MRDEAAVRRRKRGALARTVAYRLFAVLEFNAARMPGRGSAMFLHVDTGHATNGCVSLPRPQLVRVLRWLRPGATIRITA